MSRTLAILIVAWVAAALCPAEIVGETLGVFAPPAELGEFEMLPFPLDDRPLYDEELAALGPTGYLFWDRPLQHRRITQGWMVWSHGYLGDVYYTMGDVELELWLPPATGAFIFYLAPNTSGAIYTVTANGGTSVEQYVHWGYDAAGFAFYVDGEPAVLTTLTITCQPELDFAVGEFLVARLPYGAGDLNCDNSVNALDIDPFVLALTDPAGYAAAHPECDLLLGDINGDGAVNSFDIDPFVELLVGE